MCVVEPPQLLGLLRQPLALLTCRVPVAPPYHVWMLLGVSPAEFQLLATRI